MKNETDHAEQTEQAIDYCTRILKDFMRITAEFKTAHDSFVHAYSELEQTRKLVSVLIKRVDTIVNSHFDRLEIVKACSNSIKKELKNISGMNRE